MLIFYYDIVKVKDINFISCFTKYYTFLLLRTIQWKMKLSSLAMIYFLIYCFFKNIVVVIKSQHFITREKEREREALFFSLLYLFLFCLRQKFTRHGNVTLANTVVEIEKREFLQGKDEWPYRRKLEHVTLRRQVYSTETEHHCVDAAARSIPLLPASV